MRFGWRDYDPFTERWTAPDPMGDAGGDTDWYGYCLDDPVNGLDPLGLFGEFGAGYDGTSGSGYSGVGGNSTTSSSDHSGTGGNNDTSGYQGRDFGPGYNGTSGSAYGPTPNGWGYKSDTHSRNDSSGHGDSGRNKGKPNSARDARHLDERAQRNKTPQQIAQERDEYAEDQAAYCTSEKPLKRTHKPNKYLTNWAVRGTQYYHLKNY